MKNIHRYAISLYPHQSHFKNKSKCGISSDVSLFYGRSIVVCYFNSYIESNLTLSCVIESKQNVSNSFKKYDGYKALKILAVISILNIQKNYRRVEIHKKYHA